MSWTYSGTPLEEVPYGAVSFVYLITNSRTGRMYIGKKSFFFSKTKMVKKKKKRYKVESDWKDYYGSNEELLRDVEVFGRGIFLRQVLHLCASKSAATYLELCEQVDRRVLESDSYYNSWILARVRKSQIRDLAQWKALEPVGPTQADGIDAGIPEAL
jgi:hypothetical protein